MIITGTYSAFNYTIILPLRIESSCLWLHGYKERARDLLANSNLEELAHRYHMAIVFPDVVDCYYINQPWNNLYMEDILLNEFIPYIQQKYQLLTCRSTAFIGGISMGGFGSLLLGSHSNLFSGIICISAAFILNDIANGNPEVVGYHNVEHFRKLFGDFSSLLTSAKKNPILAAQTTLQSSQLPPLFLACGTEDLLHTRNLHARDVLLKSGADVTWFEQEGNHNWAFFNPAIEASFRWLFP